MRSLNSPCIEISLPPPPRSATMPAKIKSFAESALADPVTVNVGRAGATNLDIIQVRGRSCSGWLVC